MANRPWVCVLAMGGTIAMAPARDAPRPDESAGRLMPALDATDLIRAVPELEQRAEVGATTVASLPGASLRFDHIQQALEAAIELVKDGADGIVVTQGTDTLEETAYLLDLWWPRRAPLVVTGAMRAGSQPGADGPANLLDAVTVAADSAATPHGVLVVMAGEVYAARYVRKTHSTHPGAFTSPGAGPIGAVVEGSTTFAATAPAHRVLSVPPAGRDGQRPRVAVVESVLDDDGELLRLVADAGYDGVVLSACGVGHTSAAVADRVEKITRNIPVVFASRTGTGGTRSSTYGFAGSEADLIAKGAIPAGVLDHRKARLLLWALLAAGEPRVRIANEFRKRAIGG